MTVSQLYIYPIKSLGGISMETVNITDRGFEYDRRWMLVDDQDRFVSQRENPIMALLQVELTEDGLKVFHKQHTDQFLHIPFGPYSSDTIKVRLWDETAVAVLVNKNVDAWFSTMLKMPVRLVYMPDESHVVVNEKHGIFSLTSFSDGYPILLLSEASLEDLNNKLAEPLPIDRFRPNLVINGTGAFEEDGMKEFRIGDITFYGVSLCPRCVVTTINQFTAEKAKEPLKTLATYRRAGNKINFGVNVIAGNTGQINITDKVEPIKN
ncbi:MOSC domain-containing protein [Ferruginibacter sp. HRS2-29]|uniref:MOSC domain-containing protein n=1 Tax=Ferruginibacter sp. HRS2-29 TaxID=2487334 RepID=UPI0020CF0986|nr:MOSC N-terminal beta barrel domain-containing protein [Ferruginibacter sp. HRS2-29]MCP9750569.1 MOSC domain-containing protein [Ferruginibacter sp. HRS2-29]